MEWILFFYYYFNKVMQTHLAHSHNVWPLEWVAMDWDRLEWAERGWSHLGMGSGGMACWKNFKSTTYTLKALSILFIWLWPRKGFVEKQQREIPGRREWFLRNPYQLKVSLNSHHRQPSKSSPSIQPDSHRTPSPSELVEQVKHKQGIWLPTGMD